MRILEMVEQIEQQAQAAGGFDVIAPPGWSAAMPDADPRWRAAPDPATGRLFQDPDFTYPTTAGPLAFRLFYDSGNAGTDSEYGSGRRASWPLRLISDGTTVTVMHDDGVDRQYRNDGTNHFAVIGPPSGDTLTYDAVNGWDEIRGDTGCRFHFPAGTYVSLAYRATPQGLYVTCLYDTGQRLQSLVEPAGRRITLSYNGDNRVAVIQDWGYRQDTVLTYVGSDLTEVWEPEGAVTRYRYDNHLLTAVYDPLGYGTTYTYDGSSRIRTRSVAGNLGTYAYVTVGSDLQTGYTDPVGHTWTHLSSAGVPTGRIDPLGNRQTYVYQSCRPVAITNELGNTLTTSYDVYGFPVGRQDALGNRWTYTRDPAAHVLLTTQDAVGFITTYLWGADPTLRQLQTVIDPQGNRTTFGYLANGLPQFQQDPLGNRTTSVWSDQALLQAQTNALGYTTTYLYDAGTNQVGMTDALGGLWTYGFDRLRRRVSVQNPLSAISTTLFDARGQVQAQVDALGDRTSFLWNAYGSQTERIDPLGYHWTTLFDAKGRSLATVDPLGRRGTTVWDAADRRVAAVDPASLWHTTIFDAAAQTVGTMQPTGLINTTVYDAAARAVATVDPLGLRNTAVYDGAGKRVAAVQPTGARTTAVFDAAARPIASIDALGFRTTTVYDGASQPVAAIDALDNRWTTVFDAGGAAIARITPDAATTTTIYDALRRPAAAVDALGYPTSTIYDAAGRSLATVDAMGFRTTRVYDAAGQQLATVDQLGYRASVVYDVASRPVARVDALGQRATTVYDATGAVVASVDQLGQRATTVYDFAGRAVAGVDQLGNIRTTLFDSYGRAVASVDARGFPTTTAFDSYGRAVGAQDPLGYRTTVLFDSYGRPNGSVDPMGFIVTASFDLMNRVVERRDALGYRTTTVFDALGRAQATVDALNRRTTSLFDAVGRTAASVNALGCRTSFVYDLRGSQIGVQNARGYRTSTQFDALARTLATVDALNRRATLVYDGRGAIVQRLDAKAQTETLSYDALGRYSASQFADGTRVTMGYSPVSQVTMMLNQIGAYTYAYDPVGRQVSENAPGYSSGMPVTSVYDPAGNRTGLITWRGIQTATFDTRNQMTLLQDIEAGRSTWSYDPRQMISAQQNPNGTRTDTTYDATGRPLTIRHTHPNGSWLDSALYSYDPVGNPLSLDRGTGAPMVMSYDAANQILSSDANVDGVKTWTYDPVGNRLSEQSTPGQSDPQISYWTTSTYDAADQQLDEQRTGSELNSSTSSQFQYDLNGNRILETKLQGTSTLLATYLWDPSNRLAVVQDLGYVLTNTYRPDGMRHRTVDNFTANVMVRDKNDVLATVDDTGDLIQFFTRGVRAVKRYNSPTSAMFYHCDALGTMQAYSKPDGTTFERVVLDAWGGNTQAMSVDVHSYVGDAGYWGVGGLHRPLYYVRARWLVAGGPGWLSPDPNPTGPNLRSYVDSRPTAWIDPSGASAIQFTLAPEGAADVCMDSSSLDCSDDMCMNTLLLNDPGRMSFSAATELCSMPRRHPRRLGRKPPCHNPLVKVQMNYDGLSACELGGTIAAHQYGQQKLIDCLVQVCQLWAVYTLIYYGPNWCPIRVGSMSISCGGQFDDHKGKGHREGLAADIGLMHTDCGSGGISYHSASYDAAQTQVLIDLFNSTCDLRFIIFNDPKAMGVKHDKRGHHVHDNHLHVEVNP